MLPLPNLDDRNFEQLVREARDLIPGIFPDWTDENAHDPGITLLEMLAWHIEMQQFQLDRLTLNHDRKFLKLLGETPKDRVPSTTSLSFSGASEPILIPFGTLLRVGELPFETVRAVSVLPDSEQQVSLHKIDGDSVIVDDDMTSGRVTIFPFGENGDIGASIVITLLKGLPHSMPLSLWIELEDQNPEHRIPARYKYFTPSGKVEWSYWQDQNGEESPSGSWIPVMLERDETYGMHQSGPILFTIPQGAMPVRKIRAVLRAGEYNDPPRIRRLVWNEVFAKQGQSLCISECFDGLEETPTAIPAEAAAAPQIELEHALFQQGRLTVQFKQAGIAGGWRDVLESDYKAELTVDRVLVTFPAHVKLPLGKQSIRVIALSQGFDEHIYLGTGTGISGQEFLLPIQQLLPDMLRIQVGWLAEDQSAMVWYDWERVWDFDESTADCHHYVIDEAEGVIRFSDGVHGVAPPASPVPNIRIISYRTGTGVAGNVKEDMIHEFDFFNYPLHVTNLYPAYGGAEAETLNEAMHRAKLSVVDPKCGITAEDIEKRAMEIPGLRIVRVKAIPGYNTSIKNYPKERAFGHLSLVIVPYSRKPLPRPSIGMIQTIRTHLEPYRLLTTTLHVIPPEYIRVTVRAIIVVHPRYEGREHDVKQMLDKWLQPYGDDAATGWEFGKSIYKSDVYDIVHRVPGVQYIQDVWLKAEGRNVNHEEGGDIRIPPNGLAISGDHDIEFIISNG
jgi:hypothetical protein